MKEGYTVDYETFDKNDNCLVVSNFKYLNEIINYPFELSFVKTLVLDCIIGVWKIKNK